MEDRQEHAGDRHTDPELDEQYSEVLASDRIGAQDGVVEERPAEQHAGDADSRIQQCATCDQA